VDVTFHVECLDCQLRIGLCRDRQARNHLRVRPDLHAEEQRPAVEQVRGEAGDAAQLHSEQAIVHGYRRVDLGPARHPARRDIEDPERDPQDAIHVAAGLQREAALEREGRWDLGLRRQGRHGSESEQGLEGSHDGPSADTGNT
jgi:hypothetical protein